MSNCNHRPKYRFFPTPYPPCAKCGRPLVIVRDARYYSAYAAELILVAALCLFVRGRQSAISQALQSLLPDSVTLSPSTATVLIIALAALVYLLIDSTVRRFFLHYDESDKSDTPGGSHAGTL